MLVIFSYSGSDVDRPVASNIKYGLVRRGQENMRDMRKSMFLFLPTERGGALCSKLLASRIGTTVLPIMHMIRLGKELRLDYTKYQVNILLSLIQMTQLCGTGLKKKFLFTLPFI